MNDKRRIVENTLEEKNNKEKYTQQRWANYLNSINSYDKSKQDSGNKTRYMNDLIKSMRQYESENNENLKECYDNYKEAVSQHFFERWYDLEEKKGLRTLLSRCKVMVITANPIEKSILHFEIIRRSKNRIIRIIDKYNIYYIFRWNKYWVAHVHQSETGAYKDLGAGATLFDALQNFTPNVIISLGVAFGIDYMSQNLGDVLVSRRLLPYSENKLDEEKLKPDRSQDKTIDKWLHVRLINANGFIERITYGDILTGGSVLSSYDEKNKICAGYTKADFIIGGEMEGNALFQFANSNRIPSVVIKSICDWGVAKNSIFPDDSAREEQFKDSLQAYAMKKSVAAASLLFADAQLLKEPKYTDISPYIISYWLNNFYLISSSALLLLVGVSISPNFILNKALTVSNIIYMCMSIFAYIILGVNLKTWKSLKDINYYYKIDEKTILSKSEEMIIDREVKK